MVEKSIADREPTNKKGDTKSPFGKLAFNLNQVGTRTVITGTEDLRTTFSAVLPNRT
jgi:hypothetical protein